MLEPRRAPVRPRVISLVTGETLPSDDLRDALYDRWQEVHFRACGAILETRVV